jgi:hypothetical protein
MRFTLKQLLAIGLLLAGIILLLAEPGSDAWFICAPFVGGALIGAGAGALATRHSWIGFGALSGAVAGGVMLFLRMSICFGGGGLCH